LTGRRKTFVSARASISAMRSILPTGRGISDRISGGRGCAAEWGSMAEGDPCAGSTGAWPATIPPPAAGGAIWLTNVVVFALWYWELGGWVG
jgi:hypothetical protein